MAGSLLPLSHSKTNMYGNIPQSSSFFFSFIPHQLCLIVIPPYILYFRYGPFRQPQQQKLGLFLLFYVSEVYRRLITMKDLYSNLWQEFWFKYLYRSFVQSFVWRRSAVDDVKALKRSRDDLKASMGWGPTGWQLVTARVHTHTHTKRENKKRKNKSNLMVEVKCRTNFRFSFVSVFFKKLNAFRCKKRTLETWREFKNTSQHWGPFLLDVVRLLLKFK